MAGYRFPDNELQNIRGLVSQLGGDNIGINQLFDADAGDSRVTDYAVKVLEQIEGIRAAFTVSDLNVLNDSITACEDQLIELNLIGADKNPLLRQIVAKTLTLINDIKTDPYFKPAFRQIELTDRLKHYDNLILPALLVRQAREVFDKSLQDLEKTNQGRSITPLKLAEKKSFISKLFAPANKIVDSSQIQRIHPDELARAMEFIQTVKDTLPNNENAGDELDEALEDAIENLTLNIDNLPPTASPLIYNALSRLTSSLKDVLVMLNAEDNAVSAPITNVLAAVFNSEYDLFIKSNLGKHFIHSLTNDGSVSPFAKQLSDEELASFNNAGIYELQNRGEILLTLLPDHGYNLLVEKISDALENKYNDLTNAQSASPTNIKRT